ncbi:MAG TPA: ABC transporter substrate-binding protein [Chloroflexota bacterium]|nr:ABC transporter substrate-binding protein [Chloroflexota bacterium]
MTWHVFQTGARATAGALALVLALTACGQSSQQQASKSGAERLGGTVNVLATWGGDEQDSFLAMVKPFEDRTGVQVQYEGTRDLNAVLTTRVQGGNPPDVAGLPGPGQMAELGRAGKLIELSPVLDMTTMQAQYSPDWIKLGQVDGKTVGIFIKTALKGQIWHNPKAFSQAGYTVPATWDETMALSQRIAQSGTTPWCIGLESGAASGWPGTDWIENIVLRQSGPEVYDRWYAGQLRWTSPEIQRAWQTWGQIVGNPAMVFGGRQGMLATNFGDAGAQLFSSPPRCYLHEQASFITTFYTKSNSNLQPGQDFDFFMFPPFDQAQAASIEVAGDLFGMLRDTPQARALMQYLVTPEAQAIWTRRGGAISPNRQVGADAYPDPMAAKAAQIMTSAGTVRFDASDLMPEGMNNAFMRGLLDFVNDPGRLNEILTSLDRVQADTATH